jgi:hypothetical protein
MYDQVGATMLGIGTTEPGVLELMGTAVQTQFMAILPIAIPVVGGIALAFFGIRAVRALLHV